MGLRAFEMTWVALSMGLCGVAHGGWKTDTLDLERYLYQGTVAGKTVWAELGCVRSRDGIAGQSVAMRGTYRYESFPYRGDLQLEGTLGADGILDLTERVPDGRDEGHAPSSLRATGRLNGRADPGFAVVKGEWTSMDGKRRAPFLWRRFARFRRFEAKSVFLGPCQDDIDPENPGVRCRIGVSVTYPEWDGGEVVGLEEYASLSRLLEGFDASMLDDSTGSPPVASDSAVKTWHEYRAEVNVGFLSAHLGWYAASIATDGTYMMHAMQAFDQGTLYRAPGGRYQKLTLDRVVSASRACKAAVRRQIEGNGDWLSDFSAYSDFALTADGIDMVAKDTPSCCPMTMLVPYDSIPASCLKPLRDLVRKGRHP